MQCCRLWCLSTLFSYISKKKYEKLCSFWDFEANGESMICSDVCILFFRFTKENIHLGCQLIHLSHLGIKLTRDTDCTCYQANKPTCIWWHWLDIVALKNKWGKCQTGPRCCQYVEIEGHLLMSKLSVPSCSQTFMALSFSGRLWSYFMRFEAFLCLEHPSLISTNNHHVTLHV